MDESVDSAAQKYAHLHPEHQLLGWEPAAIPVYALTADLLLQRDKRFPPIDEFVLESVDAGVATLADLGGFLGLEDHVVSYTVTKQLLLDNVVFEQGEGEAPPVLRLTPRGSEALARLRFTVPAREPYRFTFDRLLWQPIPGRHVDLLRAKDAEERLVLPRAERRRLMPSDVSTIELSRLFNKFDRSQEHVDVLAVSALPRQDARYLAATLLVYGSRDGDLRFEVVIDGAVSPRHSEALAREGRAQSLGFSVGAAPAPPAMHGGLRRLQSDYGLVCSLNRQAAEERRVVGADPVQSAGRLAGAPTDAEKPQQQLADMPVRPVEPYEHRVLLREAVAKARRRLLISTSSVARQVVDKSFIGLLASRLEQSGFRAVILLGPEGAASDQDEAETLADLQSLARAHPGLTVRRGACEASTLIWDDNWIESTFDWLGHLGLSRRALRHEQGVLVRVAQEVDARFGALAASGEPAG